MVARRGSYADESNIPLLLDEHRPDQVKAARSRPAATTATTARKLAVGKISEVLIWAETIPQGWREQGRPDIAAQIVVRPR